MNYSLLNKIIILVCFTQLNAHRVQKIVLDRGRQQHDTQLNAQQTQLKPLHHVLNVNSNATTNIWVVDDFYVHPELIRYMVLQEEFYVKGNFPGPRTRSYATEEVKHKIQEVIGKSVRRWRSHQQAYNGAFQFSTSRERSWIHTDAYNTHAGVLYLTPDAPLTAGTATFRYKPTLDRYKNITTLEQTDDHSQDMTKWEIVDQIGNVFNRLILFNSKQFHMSVDYFGTTKFDSRLFQVFFFDIED